MKIFKPIALGTVVLGLLSWVAGCGQRTEYSLQGRTMGTFYHIKIVASGHLKTADLQSEIEALLERINASMSTYRPDSEISRFNAVAELDAAFAISSGFLQVMQTGRAIFELSRGAWDGTVLPLVELWGFGRAPARKTLPASETLRQVRQRVGFDHIDVDDSGFLKKRMAGVTLDLASIAKGYAVDQVAQLLKKRAFHHYLVEIGGEVYAAGRRLDGKPWRVGINQPDPSAPATSVYQVVALEDRAMATSGDYRNFYEIEGRFYSHIIDPRTGYPVSNGVVSASVFGPNCTLADGLATALMVLGPEKGIVLLDRVQGVDGIMVVRHQDGRLENFVSRGAADLID